MDYKVKKKKKPKIHTHTKNYLKKRFWNLGVTRHQEIRSKVQENESNCIINGNAKSSISLLSLAKQREMGWIISFKTYKMKSP